MHFRKKKLLKLFVTSALFAGMLSASALAAVGVVQGPTPIDQGMANKASDFTIYNDKIAASFAVGSNNYWNMTNGSILDIAVMKDGKFGTDLVNDVEFLNDYWTATGSFNNENLLQVPASDITYVKSDNKVVVTAKTRYWTAGHKLPLSVVTEYTLEDGKNYIDMKTTVTNPEGNDVYKNMNSGYSISTLAASMFGPFGYYPDKKVTGIRIGADPEVNEKYGDYVVTYSKSYAVSVQVDGANAYKGSSGYKDLYVNRDIEPGQSYVYTGELLVSNSGDTTPILERALQRDPSIPSGIVEGIVKDSQGKPLPNAYVIISKNGGYKQTVKSHGADKVMKDIMQPLAWQITDQNGKFKVQLPQDEYQIYVESKGATPSDVQTVKVNGDTKLDFAVKQGAKTSLTAVDEKGRPVNFKVQVGGIKSAVKTMGGTIFFTDPQTHRADFDVAAPSTPVTFTVYHGADYTSVPAEVTTTLKGGELFTHQFVIPTLINPAANRWYGNDNHQHSDKGDGATPIAELYKAQVAAGLDFNIVSDHDNVGNDGSMSSLAKNGKRAFIPSLEVSPGWGHWGILNVDYSKAPISPSLTPGDIIKQGHDMGALVVVNHPYTDYGFFKNRDGVKGGRDKGSEDFDFLELQSTLNLADKSNMDKRALDDAMNYWNKGVKKYLSAGSDQHDVTSGLYPGIIRLYAHIDSRPTSRNYLQAMKEGHAYVTMGPIFTPADNTMFGTTQSVAVGGAYTMQTKVQAVNGLTRIDVYNEGKVIDSKTYEKTKEPVNYSLTVKPDHDTWYSFVAMDGSKHYAVTNPVWVKVKK
jgi:hypothetical protein